METLPTTDRSPTLESEFSYPNIRRIFLKKANIYRPALRLTHTRTCTDADNHNGLRRSSSQYQPSFMYLQVLSLHSTPIGEYALLFRSLIPYHAI